jgi:cyclic pyranopterin phosphate synthase
MTQRRDGDDEARLTHLDGEGKARMVDVSGKEPTRRRAVAAARVVLGEEAFRAVTGGKVAKGDVLSVARLAGIQAAKRTSEWIPLCHPLPLEHVDVSFEPDPAGHAFEIRASSVVTARTGAEMEAMVAATAAALTVYDMCKGVAKGIRIESVRLLEKSGGRSGDWRAEEG